MESLILYVTIEELEIKNELYTQFRFVGGFYVYMDNLSDFLKAHITDKKFKITIEPTKGIIQ